MNRELIPGSGQPGPGIHCGPSEGLWLSGPCLHSAHSGHPRRLPAPSSFPSTCDCACVRGAALTVSHGCRLGGLGPGGRGQREGPREASPGRGSGLEPALL